MTFASELSWEAQESCHLAWGLYCQCHAIFFIPHPHPKQPDAVEHPVPVVCSPTFGLWTQRNVGSILVIIYQLWSFDQPTLTANLCVEWGRIWCLVFGPQSKCYCEDIFRCGQHLPSVTSSKIDYPQIMQWAPSNYQTASQRLRFPRQAILFRNEPIKLA